MIARRGLFLGAAALLAAPSIVRASALMAPGAVRPVRLYQYHIVACGPDGPPRHDDTPEDWSRWRQSLSGGWFCNNEEALAAMRLDGREASVIGWTITDTKLVLL